MSYAALGYLRQQYLCVLRRCAWFNAAMASALMCLPNVGVQAGSIVADGRTQTQVTVRGAITDITSGTIRGANAYNSFSRFNVDTANTVNLYLPGQTSNLLNLVHDQKSYINGLVNAYKDGRIGGNVFFLNPHGIVVGADGVLNVGSLTLATPTASFMDQLVNPAGVIDDVVTAQALAGQIPLSQTGLVLVKGRINAADAVNLAGGNVEVAASAQVLAGAKAQVAFSDLVNVEGLSTAAEVRVDGGVIRIVAVEDITIAGQVSADGLGANAQGGAVTVMADRNAFLERGAVISANAGETGDGGFVEFSAKDTVTLAGGSLQARAAQGVAGSILIDPENLTVSTDLLRGTGEGPDSDGITWDAGSLTLEADKKLIVGSGAVISTRNVAGNTRNDHISGQSQGDSGNLTLKAKQIEIKEGSQLLAHADNGKAAGSISITATDNQSTPVFASLDTSTASILIDNATIKGGDVTIKAEANDTWVWTGNEYGDRVLDFLGNLKVGLNISYSYANASVNVLNNSFIDAGGKLGIEAIAKTDASMNVLSTLLGFGYGETDAQAKVNIGIATLGANGDMTLRSQADSKINVEVETVNTGKFNNALSSASKFADFSFAVGVGNQVAETLVGPNATINRAQKLTLEATGAKSHSVSSSGGAFKDGTASAGVSVSISDTTFTSRLGGTTSNVQNVEVKALLTEAESEVSAAAGTAGSPDVREAITSARTPEEILIEALSGFVAGTPGMDSRSGSDGKLGLSAAFVWADHVNTVKAEVAGGAHVTTAGNLTVRAQAKEDMGFEASAAVDERETGKKTEGDTKSTEDKKKIAVSAAVVVAQVDHHADALIGDGAVISAGGKVDVLAETSVVPAWQNYNDFIDAVSNWNSDSSWTDIVDLGLDILSDPVPATLWVQTGVESEKLSLAGSIAYFDLDNKATARIGSASINAGTGPAAAGQNLTVYAHADQGIIDITGVPEFDRTDPTSIFLGNTSSGKAGFGGSYHQFMLTGGSDASIGRGANIRVDDLIVAADTDMRTIAITESGGKAGKVSIQGAFSLLDTDTDTLASIASGVTINANDVLVSAFDDSKVANAVGGIARGGSVGVGFSVAVNELDRDTLALMGNRAAETGTGGSVIASGNVLLDAHASGLQGAFTLAAAAPAGEEASDAKGGDGKKTNTADTGKQGKSGIGISADASVNLIKDTTSAKVADLTSVTTSGAAASTVSLDKDGYGTGDQDVSLVRGMTAQGRNDATVWAFAGAITIAAKQSTGLAGSFTWNQLEKITSARINGTNVTVNNGGSLFLDAENSGDMWSIAAGGAGGEKIGVAGSVAYSNVDNQTETEIASSTSSAAAVSLDSDDTSDIRSIAGSVSYGGKAGVGAAVAISTIDSDTTARITGGSVTGGTGVSAAATSDNDIFSVAAALGVSQGVAASGAVTVNIITNLTEASMSGATVSAPGQAITFDADDISSILSISGNAAISTGQASLGISASYNEIDNETYAKTANGSLTGASVRLEATEDADIQAIAAGGAGASKVAITGSLGINTIGNITEASSTGTGITTSGDAQVRATDTSSILSITGAIGIAGNGAVGAAGSYNHIGSTVTAAISGGLLSVGNLLVDAERAANVEVWAVAGSGAGTAGFAGSIALNDVGGVTTARVGEAASVTATGNAVVTAESDDEIESRAGAVAVGGTVGGSGSIAFNDVHSDTLAEITGANTQVTAQGNGAAAQVDNGLLTALDPNKLPSQQPVSGRQLKDSLRGVAVVASSTSQVENFVISASGGGTAGVAGAVSVAMMTGYTSAEVSDNASVNTSFGGANQEARIAAYHHDNFGSGSGGAGVGGSAGIGGAMDTLIESHITTARVKDATVQAQKAVRVDAGATTEIAQAVIGLGIGGYAGLAGSFGLILIDSTTQAIADNGDLNSKGSLTVEATSETITGVAAGALAASGAAGIGLTGTVTIYDQNTYAWVMNGSHLNATGATSVRADSYTDHETYAATAAAAGGVGIAGTVDVVVVKGSTEAVVATASDINADATYDGTFQDVTIHAEDTTQVDNKVGGLGVGLGGVGVGAAVDVVLINNGATARVDSGTSVNAKRDISVSADTTRDTNAVVVAAAGGLTAGISGAVSVVSIGARPDADARGESRDSVGEAARKMSANAFGNQIDSDAGGISDSRDRANTARAKADVGADMDATHVNSTAAATVAGVVDAGQHVTVSAHNRTDTDAVTIGAAVSGGLAIGGGVALAFVDDKTVASMTGGATAGGNVNVTALDDQPDLSKLRTYAGGGGLVGLGASVAVMEKKSTATAELGGIVKATSGTVTVDAGIDHNLESEGGAAAVGVAGIGAAIGYVTEGGQATASVKQGADITSDGLEVHGHSRTHSLGVTIAAAGGIVSGAGSDANVLDESIVRAEMNGGTNIDGSVNVHADATPEAIAKTLAISVSASLSIGASLADAEASTQVYASVGPDVQVTADNLTVRAQLEKVGDTVYAEAEGASGGLLIGANATVADAAGTSYVDAHVGANTDLDVSGAVLVEANTDSKQRAYASGLSLGFLALGANLATATSGTQTYAWLGDGVNVHDGINLSDAITVNAVGLDHNRADSVSGSGGVVSGSAATATTDGTSMTKAWTGGGDDTHQLRTDSFRLLASHTTQYNSSVDSLNASLVGASGAYNSNTVFSTVDASVGEGGRINAHHVDIDAENASYKFWLGANTLAEDMAGNGDGAGFNINSGSGGVIDLPAGRSVSHVTHVTDAAIGADAQVHVLLPSLGLGTFTMDAFNDIVGHDKAKLDSGGAVAVAMAASHFYVDRADAGVTFGADSEVINDEGDINAGARARVDLDTRATADTYGFAGAPSGEAYSYYTGMNQAIVEGGAFLKAAEGAINLAGGASSGGTRTSIVAESDVKLWNKTAIPIATLPDAQSGVISNALIDLRDSDPLDDQLQGDSQVWAAGDISLIADKGQISATAVGIGKDIYREALAAIANAFSNLFGGDDVSFEVRGGVSSVDGTATARVDGEALTGINRFESLTLNYKLVDRDGNEVDTPVRDPNSGLVLWERVIDKTDGVTIDIERAKGVAASIQDRINKLRSLMSQYAADPIAVAAYDAEIRFLQFKLVELGLASQDPTTGAINVGQWNNPSPKEATATSLAQNASQAIGEQTSLTGDPTLVNDKGVVGDVIADFDTVDQNNGSFTASTQTVNGNLAMLSKYNANDGRITQINQLASGSDTLRSDINTLMGTNRTLQQSISEKTSQINDLLLKPTLSTADFTTIESNASQISSLMSQVATNDGLINTKTDTLHGNLSSIASLQSQLANTFRESDDKKAGYAADQTVLGRITPLTTINTARIGEIDGASSTINSAYTAYFNPNTANSYTAQVADLAAELPGESSKPANGPIADFITVDDITVRLGNIKIKADNLVGSGALKAPGDASIVITNNTPNFLVLNDLTVASESGGMIRLNNFLINDNAEINRINSAHTGAAFGTIQTRDNQGAGLPEILIHSNYDPNSAKDKKLPAPSPNIEMAGDISNSLGLVEVRSKAGSIYVDGNIRAAQVDVRADNGDFVQSYVDGFYHVSGDPAANTQGGVSLTPPGAGIVANGSVFISARYLNINGLVQSGIESWTLTLPAAPVLTGPADLYGLSQTQLDDLTKAYKNGGVARTLVASNSGGSVYFDAVDGRLEADTGFADADRLATDWATRTGKYSGLYPLAPDYGNIGSNYDPSVTGGRYVLDGSLVRGGYIQLYGQIVNTADGSAGKLRVLDGYGQIVITNPTDRPVVINNLDTGIDLDGTGRGMVGVIDITDIQRVVNNQVTNTSTVDAIHTVITRENGHVYLDQTGRWNGAVFEPNYTFTGMDGKATDGRHTTYNPQTGLRYVWTTALDTSKNTYWQFSGSQFLGISQLRTKPTGSVESVSGPFTVNSRRLDDGTFLVKNVGQTGNPLFLETPPAYTTSDVWTKTGEWTNCNWWTLCIAQNYHTTWTQTTGQTTVTRHSLKADYPIVIEFIGWDAGLVAINSRSSVSLEGAISNRYGDTTITAGVNPGSNVSLVRASQSILQGDAEAMISTRNLTMLASGGVGNLLGVAPEPVRIDLNGGLLKATASNGNVAVTQTTGDLRIDLVSAAGSANAGLGVVSLEAEGGIAMGASDSLIQGNRIELAAVNGGIGVESDPLTVRVGYTDTLTERGGYGLKAAAGGGIYMETEKWADNLNGDLLVSSVASATGDVVLSAPGRILDNNPFESIDQRSYDQLLAYWDKLGLLENTDANDKKQEDAVKAFEHGATQSYRNYWLVRGRQADPSAYDPNFQYSMSTAQEQALRTDLAKQGMVNADIDKVVGNYETEKTNEYHSLHAQLYNPATGIYENPLPTAYNKDFVYNASSAEEDEILHGSSWSERQLGISVTPGLLKEITDTNPVLKDPNVSGQTVKLLAGTGLGATQGTMEISASIAPRDLTPDQKVALAAAERADLDLSDPSKIVIIQRKPLMFDAEQTLYATNPTGGAIAGNVYLGSESPVNVGALFATGEARLKSARSINDVAGVGVAGFQTGSLVLEAAQGGIGSAASPVHVQIADDKSLIARAEGDIFIDALSGDLNVDTVYSRNDVRLAAPGSILDAFDTNELNIRARSLDMTAGGSIGEWGNHLDIGLDARLAGTPDSDSTGWLTADAGNGIYLRNEQQPVIIRSANAGTEARFVGGALTVDGTIDAPLGIDIDTGGQLTLTDRALLKTPANPLVISADSLRTEAGAGAATLDAASIDLTVIGGAEFAGDLDAGNTDVNLRVGDDLHFSGGMLKTGGAVNLATGTDGSGSILGHAGAGTDVRSGGLLTVSAPDAVGEGDALEFLVDAEARINARRVNAAIAPIAVSDPLTVNVAGASGGLADEVTLDLTSETRVLVDHLASELATVYAHAPRYTVTLGQLGNYALHYTPNYAIRVDHQERGPITGFDVRAFTLSGDYSLDVMPGVAEIGAFVISQNPRLIVNGDPPGSADLESMLGLRSQQSSWVFPNLAAILLEKPPVLTDPVEVQPGLMDEERLLGQ